MCWVGGRRTPKRELLYLVYDKNSASRSQSLLSVLVLAICLHSTQRTSTTHRNRSSEARDPRHVDEGLSRLSAGQRRYLPRGAGSSTIRVERMIPSRELTTMTHNDDDCGFDQPSLDELITLREAAVLGSVDCPQAIFACWSGGGASGG